PEKGGRMDLRATATALWLLALLLGLRALPEREAPPPSDCPDAKRQWVDGGTARGRLPLLPCPDRGGERPAQAPRGPAGLLLGRPIDLNEATLEELQALPGIGPGLARRIVEERERRGPFTSLEDLARVRGIGPARVDALRGLADAAGPR